MISNVIKTMTGATKIFTKGERELLHLILQGKAAGTKGVKISCFRRKIENKLATMGKDIPQKDALNLMLHRYGNKQDVWLAAYKVCEDERPGLFETLKKKQTHDVLVEA